MRIILPLVVLAALAALPGALALGAITVTVPNVEVGVQGARQDIDTTTAAPGAGLVGTVGFHDVNAHTGKTSCTVDARAKLTKLDPCQTQAPETSSALPTDIVYADVDVLLPVAAQSGDADVKPQSAAVPAPLAAEPAAAGALVAAAAAGVSLAAVYGVWRLLKWTGLAAILPFYTHIRDDEILDDPNRAAIYRLIQAEAGISTKDIADRLGLAWGTVTHHLGKLEKRRFVVSKKYGKYRRYFANGAGGTEHKDEVAVLRLDRTGDVAALIRANPGVTQKAVSLALGVSSSTILWHVKRLEEVHLVTKVRQGKIVRYYPSEGLDQVLVAPAAPTPGAA